MAEFLVALSVGLGGLLAPGFLARMLGPWLWRPRALGFLPASGLVALVPAHDEEENLPRTLASLIASSARAGFPLRICVGADACSDGTAAAGRAAGAEVEEVEFRSKWKTLAHLSRHARAGEWVALVDAGAVWPVTLLADLEAELRNPALLGIAPAYHPRGASLPERSLWLLEACWKRGENRSGGPVSVHGATVFYRAEAFQAALTRLASAGWDTWLNDDVALPLATRAAFPGGAIRYWCPRETARRVSDLGLREGTPGFGRRQRLVAGNLQWMVALLPRVAGDCPAAALVALRRALRVFWAYWALCLAYALAYALFRERGVALATTFGVCLFSSLALLVAGQRSLPEAGLASLLAPFSLYCVYRGRMPAWS